ncbi:hypothetical protein NKG05_18060 [Oerskovia sp. M15]
MVLTSREAYLRRYAEDDKARAAAQASGRASRRGTCRTGTWTRAWRRCSCSRPRSTRDWGLLLRGAAGPGRGAARGARCARRAPGHGRRRRGAPGRGAAGAGGSPTRRPRRALEDVVHRGGW